MSNDRGKIAMVGPGDHVEIRPQGGISRVMHNLEAHIAIAEAGISQLRGALESVLKPEHPHAETMPDKLNKADSPLVSDLQKIADRIKALNDEIAGITNRIDV